MSKWGSCVAHFVNKFLTVAKLLGHSSILTLLRSYEIKEHAVRLEMSQLRSDAIRRGKFKLQVNRKMAGRDGNKQLLFQVLDALTAQETASAEHSRFDKSGQLTPMAVNDVVVAFTGERGEGTALLLACFSEVAKELRSGCGMFKTMETEVQTVLYAACLTSGVVDTRLSGGAGCAGAD